MFVMLYFLNERLPLQFPVFPIIACGGHIRSIGESLRSPNYPMNYPNGITCIWQISFNQPIELDFLAFRTSDYHDKVQIWDSLTDLSCKRTFHIIFIFGAVNLVSFLEEQQHNRD